MRLIDADKMLAELEEGYDDCNIEEMLEFVDISNCIKRQPVAYDVDKVVEELEEEIEENQDASLGEYRAGLYKAIDIVKAGRNR